MSHNAKSELTKNALADSLKKLMISKGHTYYQSRKLDRVPREAVEELLGINFTDKSN